MGDCFTKVEVVLLMISMSVCLGHAWRSEKRKDSQKVPTVPATSDHFATFVFILIVRSAASSLTLDTLEPEISRRTTKLKTGKPPTYL